MASDNISRMLTNSVSLPVIPQRVYLGDGQEALARFPVGAKVCPEETYRREKGLCKGPYTIEGLVFDGTRNLEPNYHVVSGGTSTWIPQGKLDLCSSRKW
ncbi:MAG: hypothetical protein JW727_05695 [Candidatus Aenigmarchaeota archaeon]|nr:hypothetical protein [Candidatus Aenigmarchaeota archaeon]